jgi:hypothetical protein
MWHSGTVARERCLAAQGVGMMSDKVAAVWQLLYHAHPAAVP